MSTLLFALSAARRTFPDALLEIARPVYEAPGAVTLTMAASRFTCGAQPLIVPSRVANRKTAANPLILTSGDPLNTIPVGVPGPSPPAVGIKTLRGTLVPLASWRVDQPEVLSLIQKVPLGG